MAKIPKTCNRCPPPPHSLGSAPELHEMQLPSFVSAPANQPPTGKPVKGELIVMMLLTDKEKFDRLFQQMQRQNIANAHHFLSH